MFKKQNFSSHDYEQKFTSQPSLTEGKGGNDHTTTRGREKEEPGLQNDSNGKGGVDRQGYIDCKISVSKIYAMPT